MPQRNEKKNGCGQRPGQGERRVVEMGFDKTERALLALARLYFLTFSDPATQSWMRASALARCTFGPALGPSIAHALLEAVNELRLARSSGFQFSNPDCPCCAQILCDAERHFMAALSAVRLGRQSAAHGNALLLCEGADTAQLLAALAHLHDVLDDAQATRRTEETTG